MALCLWSQNSRLEISPHTRKAPRDIEYHKAFHVFLNDPHLSSFFGLRIAMRGSRYINNIISAARDVKRKSFIDMRYRVDMETTNVNDLDEIDMRSLLTVNIWCLRPMKYSGDVSASGLIVLLPPLSSILLKLSWGPNEISGSQISG